MSILLPLCCSGSSRDYDRRQMVVIIPFRLYGVVNREATAQRPGSGVSVARTYGQPAFAVFGHSTRLCWDPTGL